MNKTKAFLGDLEDDILEFLNSKKQPKTFIQEPSLISTGSEDQIVEIAESFDPEIGILRLDRTNGSTLAVLYNFAIHPYTGVPNRGVTASTPGFASKIIEENIGNDVISLFINGAAGDITPILYKDVNAPKPDKTPSKLGIK